MPASVCVCVCVCVCVSACECACVCEYVCVRVCKVDFSRKYEVIPATGSKVCVCGGGGGGLTWPCDNYVRHMDIDW